MNEHFGIPELAAGVVLGLVGIAYGLQKLLKGWKDTSTEMSIVTLMHTELDRLSKHNATLSIELNRLQLELVSLHGELQKLTIENNRLHAEVREITKQLARLKSVPTEDNNG